MSPAATDCASLKRLENTPTAALFVPAILFFIQSIIPVVFVALPVGRSDTSKNSLAQSHSLREASGELAGGVALYQLRSVDPVCSDGICMHATASINYMV